MKTSIKLMLMAVMVLSITACKNTKKQSKTTSENGFSVVDSTATVKWTAYKTTAKLPVSGVFQTINITKSTSGASAVEALNNLEFNIPISSLFSKNEERDGKLKNLFFGVMKNTTLLSGVIHVTSATMGSLEITMNDVTKSLPITFQTDGNTINFKGVMNLPDWNVGDALASLNKACYDLHKGPDGISKTWDDVAIEASVQVKK